MTLLHIAFHGRLTMDDYIPKQSAGWEADGAMFMRIRRATT